MFRGLKIHWRYPLELFLPFVNQFGSLPQVLYFVTFAVRHCTSQRVSGGSRLFHKPSQAPQTVVHGCFRSCMFSERTCFLMHVRCFALELDCPLARLLQVSASLHVQRPAIVDLPKGPIQVRPAGGYHALARDLHLIMQTVLVLPGLVKVLSPSSVSRVTFFMIFSKISYSSAKVSRACVVFWLRSQALVFASGFFLYVELRLPFRWFKRRCSSHSFFSVRYVHQLGGAHLWCPRPNDCTCLHIQQDSHEGPACSVQNKCLSKSVAYSWMVTIPYRTMMKIGHLHVCSGTFRQKWKEGDIALNTEARFPKWLMRDDFVNDKENERTLSQCLRVPRAPQRQLVAHNTRHMAVN